MPVGFRNWTVLPHDPIVPLAPNLWLVEGLLGKTNRRTMVLARLGDGRIIMHNAIALDKASMERIDAWGEVTSILIPNRFHRQDAFIMQECYPRARVYAPTGALNAASKATPCTGAFRDVLTDSTVTLRDLEGVGMREGVMLVTSDDGLTAVFCDTLLNLPKKSGLLGLLMHPTGMLSMPRMAGWMLAKDRHALRRDLGQIARIDGLRRVIPGHGAIVSDNASEQLLAAAERVG